MGNSRRSYSKGGKRSGSSGGKKSYQSTKHSGLYTKSGQPIRNASAYAATGAKAFNRNGGYIHKPAEYSSVVRNRSMVATAKAAARGGAKAYSYVATLDGGRETYVGYTRDPTKRTQQHISGSGAAVTREICPQSITFTPHSSVATARRAETRTYYAEKQKSCDKYGQNNVRGAGYTSRFPKSHYYE